MPLDIQIDDDVYFSEPFKVIVRSCKEQLIRQARELVLIDRSFMFAHRNNFYTFLRGLGIDERLIWPTAFINDIIIPSENFMDKQKILLVTIESIDSLKLQYNQIKNN